MCKQRVDRIIHKPTMSIMKSFSMPLAITTLLALNLPSSAQEEQAAEKKERKPIVTKIDENLFAVGKIKLNKQTKEISFPATLGNPDSIIEYLIVNEHGKIHETLLITEIRPLNLNIAMKLLGYKESKELFKILDKDYIATDQYHTETDEVKKLARFDIYIEWLDGEEKRSHHINELIYNTITKKHALIRPYVYTGSYLLEGKFKADISGDIIAILTTRASLANFSNEGRYDDTIWHPNPKKIPKPNTPLTIIFKKHTPPNSK